MEDILDESGVVVIIPARMGSRRLPGKPLLPLGDATVLEQVVRRVRAAKFGRRLIVATSDDTSDYPIRNLCATRGIPFFAGSLNDVLDRTIRAAQEAEASVVVRCLTSSPLLDPKMLDAGARYTLDSGMDYVTVARLPQGVASEAVPLRTLIHTAERTVDALDREEVTTFAAGRLDLFERAYLPPPLRLARQDIRLTLETEADYRILAHVFAEVPPRENGLLSVEDVIHFMDADPRLRAHGHAPAFVARAA